MNLNEVIHKSDELNTVGWLESLNLTTSKAFSNPTKLLIIGEINYCNWLSCYDLLLYRHCSTITVARFWTLCVSALIYLVATILAYLEYDKTESDPILANSIIIRLQSLFVVVFVWLDKRWYLSWLFFHNSR